MLEFVLDPTWFLILAPVLALALWARRRSARALDRGRAPHSPAGWTAAAVAAAILEAERVEGVSIVRGSGPMADFYDAPRRTIRLADPDGDTPADLAIAAREAGQAIREAHGDRLGRLRRPLAFGIGLASDAAWMLILAGFLLAFYRLVLLGAVALAAAATGGLAACRLGRVAGRLGLLALSATGRLDPEQERVVADAIEALPWSDVASILPGIGRRRDRRIPPGVRGPSGTR